MARGRDQWQRDLAESIDDGADLCRRLGLPGDLARPNAFPLLVPRSFVDRMRPGDPHDPLLRQVLPAPDELLSPPEFTADPLGEAELAGSSNTLWKYPNRLLIVTVARCAVHCRFCFRRHFFCHREGATNDNWEGALERIAAEPSIHEAILSGGDPLMLDDDRLADLVRRLAAVAHLTRFRVHTRMPIVLPSRVTPELVAVMRSTRLAPVVVVHANHVQEIDERVAAALARLVDAGVVVLSQSVLLRGVNDSVEALAALLERLIDLRVMPYYLHQLDRVAGAAHFEVPEAEGVRLMRHLRERLPGYAVPRYVRELPRGESKQMIEASAGLRTDRSTLIEFSRAGRCGAEP